jgi:hypothetical protein
LIGLCAARADAGALYRVTDLGDFQVAGISNSGQVIGDQAYTYTQPWDGKQGTAYRSVIYQDGSFTPVTVPGSSEVVMHAVISPGGTIAYSGGANYGQGSGPSAHVIMNGQVTNTGQLGGWVIGGYQYSIPHAVNDSGTVAGEAHLWYRYNQAFTAGRDWTGQYKFQDLGANGGTVSNAFALNNSGLVVGVTDVAGHWKSHAFVGGPSSDIGTLGGQGSAALGVNDKGQVVGLSNIATDWKAPANPESYYTPEPVHAFLYQGGKMQDLGTLPGDKDSAANAINSQGQIVGQSAANGSSGIGQSGQVGWWPDQPHAVLFDHGNVLDLNRLIDPAMGWLLQNAIGINDAGQIIGEGTLGGSTHGFLLTPMYATPTAAPEPRVWIIFTLIGAVPVMLRRRARGTWTRAATR